MQKRSVTRYAMRSPEASDDSFLHVSIHDHGGDEVNPIASTASFTHLQDGHEERRAGGVDQQTATLVGAYIRTIA